MAAVIKDVVVLLPGLLGSVLQREGKEIWGLSGSAIFRALFSGLGSVKSLTLTSDAGGALADDGVEPVSVLPDTHLIPGLWKVDGYTRVAETLVDLRDAWGERRAVVARELTKVHEEFVRGSLSALIERYTAEETRGEVVVLVEGRTGEHRWSEEELRRALEEGLGRGEKLKGLSTELARRAGWAGQDVYRLGLGLKKR